MIIGHKCEMLKSSSLEPDTSILNCYVKFFHSSTARDKELIA